jgi:hypothetical protein
MHGWFKELHARYILFTVIVPLSELPADCPESKDQKFNRAFIECSFCIGIYIRVVAFDIGGLIKERVNQINRLEKPID